MGYMDISIFGSDYAADNLSELHKAIAIVLKKQLKESSNEFNTPGPVNVALFFEEIFCKNMKYFHCMALADVAAQTSEELEKLIALSEKADWEDLESKSRHMKRYKELLKSLKKFINNDN